MADDASSLKPNSFRPLIADLTIRFRKPLGQVSFWVYLLLAILLFGGVAIWIELIRYFMDASPAPSMENLLTSVETYVPAVGCSAAAQLALSSESKKHLRSFAWLLSFLFFTGSILLILANGHFQRGLLRIAFLASALAILTWWIANGLDPSFQDDVAPESSIGGPVTGSLQGNMTGFKS